MTDMSALVNKPSAFIHQGFTHADKAIRHDKLACQGSNPEDFDTAKNSYLRAIEYYMAALKYEKNNRVRSSLKEKINSYVERAEIMKDWLQKYEARQKAEIGAKLEKYGNPHVAGSSSTLRGGGMGDLEVEKAALKKEILSALLNNRL